MKDLPERDPRGAEIAAIDVAGLVIYRQFERCNVEVDILGTGR